MKSVLSLVAALLVLPVFAINAINLNNEAHLSGPKLKAEDIEGKVILLEFFGHGCGPCVSAMPGTVALAKKHKDDPRLVTIASHLWGRNEDRIKAFLERTGAEKLPTYQELTFEGVAKPRGVPHAVVLGHNGKVIWEGHPGNHDAMADAVAEGLKKAPKIETKPLSLKERFEQRKAQRQKAEEERRNRRLRR